MSNWLLRIAGLLVATAIALHPATAKPRDQARANAQAIELFRLGKFSEAAALAESVVANTERELGPKHPNFATALNSLAVIYEAQGRYAEALPLHQRALAIREAVLPPNHPDIARSLSNLAIIYQRQARYAEAEPLYKRLLGIFETTIGPDHPDVATSLNNMGELYREQYRFNEAEQTYKRALVIREKALGPDHPSLAQTLNNLANLYQMQGRFAESEAFYKRSIAILERAKGPDYVDLVSPLNNLGELCRVLGRTDEARSSLLRAIAILERQFGPDHPGLASSLSNLANIETESGHFADAARLSNRAVSLLLQRLPPDHPDIAMIRGNIGEMYRREGRLAEAETLMSQTVATLERGLGPDHLRVGQALNNVARLYRDQGRDADALEVVERLIPKGHYRPPLALSVLSRAEGKNLISAEKALDDALKVVERSSRTSASTAVNKLGVRLAAGSDRLGSLIRKDQDLASEGEALDKAVFSAISRDPSQRDAASERRSRERLVAVVQERASLAKTLAAEFPDYSALSNPLPLATREIQSLLSDDEALVLFFSFPDKTGEREVYVFAIMREAAIWRPSPLSVEALSQKVAAFRHGLDIDKIAGVKDTPDKALLFDLDLAHELYASLFSDIEALVRDKKRLLIVPTGPLTALPFNLLVTEKPPAAIPAGFDGYRDAAWLIKRQAVSVLPSVASLKVLRTFARNDRATRPMVGFGDPVFDFTRSPAGGGRAATKSAARSLVAGAYTDFWQGAGVDRSKLAKSLPQLPDTADELNAVALKLGAPPSDIHLGLDANETLVKRAPLADYSVVYFATHGLVAGDVKGLGEPSLVLSLPKQPSDLDDGLLTSSEVAQLKLNADWVVLSACNTIAGDKPGAEALSGLARSFFYAGARALLVSHWAVDSEAASRLATSTFERLKSDPKIGRAEALRQSMLDYLNDTSQPKNAYPAFWGPFTLIGEGASR